MPSARPIPAIIASLIFTSFCALPVFSEEAEHWGTGYEESPYIVQLNASCHAVGDSYTSPHAECDECCVNSHGFKSCHNERDLGAYLWTNKCTDEAPK